MSLLEAFEKVCRETATEFPHGIDESGRWFRGDAYDPEGNRHKGAAAAACGMSQKGVRCISIWNHVTQAQGTAFEDDGRRGLSREEIERQARIYAEARRKQKAVREQAGREAAERGAEQWRHAVPAVECGHPYLARKRVKPVEPLRVLGAVLLVPYFAFDAAAGSLVLRHFQTIDAEGVKRFPKGSAHKGAFWAPDSLRRAKEPPCRVGIAEGVATAMSVTQVNGFPCVAAGSCGSLKDAALALRMMFPGAELVICSDRGNGEKDAEKAAAAVMPHAVLALPEFTPEDVARYQEMTGSQKAPTDFNDLYAARGLL